MSVGDQYCYGRHRHMAKQRREIDERDIDRLLAALTDRQIAQLYGMTEFEVSQLRQARRAKLPARNENHRKDQTKRKS